MDTKQFECFFEIVKHGSFTAAATHLYTNQSTVSRKISELESELGMPLFKRNSRILELTQAGEIFYEEGQEILRRINALHSKIENISIGKAGKLIIGMPFNILGLHERRMIRTLRTEYPSLQLSFISLQPEEVNTAVENGDIDAAITLDHLTKTIPEEIVKKPFFKDKVAFIVHDEDELCGKAHVVIEDLYSKPLVLWKSSKLAQPEFIARLLVQIGQKKMTEPIFCNNYESMVMEVSLENGIGILPRLLVERNPSDNIKSIEVEGIDDAMNYVILYNKKNVKPGMESFISKCIELANS